MRKSYFFPILLAFLSIPTAKAQINSPAAPKIDLPIIEMPFNGSRYFPDYFSMRQSLALSTDLYESAHFLLAGPPEEQRSLSSFLKVAAFDFLSLYFPLSSSWMHEEWHRSVMTHRKIGSFNDVNLIPWGQELIAVSHVDDVDLIRLKREHPADQVRLSSAGMESQVAQNQLIERHHFFDNVKTADQLLLWINAINVTSYLYGCSTGYADHSTEELNREDGSDIARRDFTGLDCTAWVYDLFRPDEPYTARGTHPSGVGVDRYIQYSDLNDKEKRFLHLQRNLSFLNFADPFLFHRDEFRAHFADKEWRWNLKLSHYLTSFGGTVDTILFLKSEEQKFLLTWHHGMTDTRYLPGISAEWIDQALPWDKFSLSTGLTVWPQPREQRIEDTSTDTLLDASARLAYQQSARIKTYIGLEAKTPGWMAGNVYLERNVSFWGGIEMDVF